MSVVIVAGSIGLLFVWIVVVSSCIVIGAWVVVWSVVVELGWSVVVGLGWSVASVILGRSCVTYGLPYGLLFIILYKWGGNKTYFYGRNDGTKHKIDDISFRLE